MLFPSELDDDDDVFCWYYKSNNSDLWWKYDRNSNNEIENAYKVYLVDEESSQVKMLIAGNVYIIDFKANLQIRNENRMLKRKIKRDKVNFDDLKGVAGLKIKNGKEDKCKNDADDLVNVLNKLNI